MNTVHTFGDSVLDCGRYNDHGVTPAALLARNDDTLFPAFRGRDVVRQDRQSCLRDATALASLQGEPALLEF